MQNLQIGDKVKVKPNASTVLHPPKRAGTIVDRVNAFEFVVEWSERLDTVIGTPEGKGSRLSVSSSDLERIND